MDRIRVDKSGTLNGPGSGERPVALFTEPDSIIPMGRTNSAHFGHRCLSWTPGAHGYNWARDTYGQPIR